MNNNNNNNNNKTITFYRFIENGLLEAGLGLKLTPRELLPGPLALCDFPPCHHPWSVAVTGPALASCPAGETWTSCLSDLGSVRSPSDVVSSGAVEGERKGSDWFIY